MSLAKLVVHLQANYSGLTSGLAVARDQTVAVSQDITRSLSGIRPESVMHLADKAEEAATYLEAMATAAEVVEHSVSAAAFTAEVASNSFTRMGATAHSLGTAFGVIDKSTAAATGGLQTLLAVSGKTAPALQLAASASGSLAGGLSAVTGAFRLFSVWMTRAGSLTRTVAGGIAHIAHSLHAAMIVASLLRTAFAMLMVPIKALLSVAVAVFHTMQLALRTVLLPVKLLWNGFTALAASVWGIVKPLLSLGLAVAKVWFIFRGWVGAVKTLLSWLTMLPPKTRLLVGGLLALGLAGKAGAFALRIVAMSVRAVTFVARGAIAGLQALSLPLLAIRNPARAAAVALNLLTGAIAAVGRAAASAGLRLLGLVGHVSSLARQGVSAAVGSFTSLAATLFKVGTQATVYGAMAASVWGVKLATAAETSRVVFGTMLHDMAQGKALLAQMQSSKVAPFFDAKQIQDAGRDLLKAKVPVDQITGRLEQLGGIALATKTPIEDLSRIYRQGMAKGAFQTDLVNQMAERGIDIYAALTAVTGLSGQALADAMKDGKIGAAEMNAAIDHMTTGHGIYAGVVENVAQTTAGMWSTSMNNMAMAFQTMFGMAVDGNKGLLSSWVDLTEQIKQRAMAIAPVIMQLTNVVSGLFLGLFDVVRTVWAAVFGTTQATFSDMLQSTMAWVTKFRWFFTNLVPIVQFVGLLMLQILTGVFNDISYWFTDTMPAYLEWFANNWMSVFHDIAAGTMAVFANLTQNVGSAMKAIWDYIASGGSRALEFTWTPLLDGFKSTVAALPEVPERAMSALESGMQEQIETIGTLLADSFDAMMAESAASMAAAAAVEPPVTLQSTPAGADPSVTGADDAEQHMKKEKKIADNKAVQSRSEEGQNIVASFLKGIRGTENKSVTKAQIDTEKHLAKLARDSDRAPRLMVEKA